MVSSGKARSKRRQQIAKAQKKLRKEAERCVPCGKTSWKTHNLAIKAIEQGRSGLRAYECPYGNGWHTTSQVRIPKEGQL